MLWHLFYLRGKKEGTLEAVGAIHKTVEGAVRIG